MTTFDRETMILTASQGATLTAAVTNVIPGR
jgi:hypothetical protein